MSTEAKNTFLVFSFILMFSFIFFACTDDEQEIQSIYFGNAEATRNGEAYLSDVRSQYSSSDGNKILITFDRFEGNVLRTQLSFININPFEKAFQFILPDTALTCERNYANFFTGFGDSISDIYFASLEDTLEDWIVIDSFNTQTAEFWGRFQISFVRDERFGGVDIFADTLRFENGIFNGRVLER